jgi:hypothetical protein
MQWEKMSLKSGLLGPFAAGPLGRIASGPDAGIMYSCGD